MMTTFQKVLMNAEHIASGVSNPLFSRADYENAMLDIAKAATPPGDSTATTFVKLCEAGDQRITKLYNAARLVDRLPMGKSNKAEVYERMTKYATALRAPGETAEAAHKRLLESDATMQELYRQYSDAS